MSAANDPVLDTVLATAPSMLLAGAALTVVFTAWTTDSLEKGSRWIVVWSAALIALAAIASVLVPAQARWGVLLSLVPGFLIIQYGAVQASIRRPGAAQPDGAVEQRLRPAAELVRRSVGTVFSPAVIGASYGVPALLSAAVLGTALFTLRLHPDSAEASYLVPDSIASGARWGLLGAYVLVLLRLGQRAVTRDMTTGVVIWTVISLALGPIVGGLAAVAWHPSDDTSLGAWRYTAVYFFAGFAPRWFISVVEEAVKRLFNPTSSTQAAAARVLPLTLVRGITTDIAERLAEESVADVNALAMADPVRLFRNTNYSKRLILDWIDEALLMVGLPETWQALERLGITGAIDLAWCEAQSDSTFETLAREAHIDTTILRTVARRLYEDVQVQLVWFLYQYEEGLPQESGEKEQASATQVEIAKEGTVTTGNVIGVETGTSSCWFTTSDATVVLSGRVFHLNDPSTADPVRLVDVANGSSSQFSLDTGDYRYEFNIVSGPKFTLKLFAAPPGSNAGSQVQCTPSDFDPAVQSFACRAVFTV